MKIIPMNVIKEMAMKKCLSLAATTLLFGAATAQGALLTVSGTANTTIPLGTAVSDNNVVNSGTSGLSAGGSDGWFSTGDGEFLSTTAPSLTLRWYFAGAESGNTFNVLKTGNGGADTIVFAESNENNNVSGPTPGPSFLGSYVQTASGLVDMRFFFNTDPLVSNNGVTRAAPGILFAYVTGSLATGWTYSSTPTDQVAFGLNDNFTGTAGDDNHDDWMGVVQAVPVPAAAWLLAPAIAGLAGFARRRHAAA